MMLLLHRQSGSKTQSSAFLESAQAMAVTHTHQCSLCTSNTHNRAFIATNSLSEVQERGHHGLIAFETPRQWRLVERDETKVCLPCSAQSWLTWAFMNTLWLATLVMSSFVAASSSGINAIVGGAITVICVLRLVRSATILSVVGGPTTQALVDSKRASHQLKGTDLVIFTDTRLKRLDTEGYEQYESDQQLAMRIQLRLLLYPTLSAAAVLIVSAIATA